MISKKKKIEKKDDIENIVKLAFKNIYDVSTKVAFLRYLKIWWCFHYKRPAKDPLLDFYTFEELLLEYFEQNLYNNKEKIKKIETDWLMPNLTDDEWYKELEKEVGPIDKLDADFDGSVHEEF